MKSLKEKKKKIEDTFLSIAWKSAWARSISIPTEQRNYILALVLKVMLYLNWTYRNDRMDFHLHSLWCEENPAHPNKAVFVYSLENLTVDSWWERQDSEWKLNESEWKQF